MPSQASWDFRGGSVFLHLLSSLTFPVISSCLFFFSSRKKPTKCVDAVSSWKRLLFALPHLEVTTVHNPGSLTREIIFCKCTTVQYCVGCGQSSRCQCCVSRGQRMIGLTEETLQVERTLQQNLMCDPYPRKDREHVLWKTSRDSGHLDFDHH